MPFEQSITVGFPASFLFAGQDFLDSGKRQPDSASRRPDENGIRVLVVDDDRRIAETVVEVLQTAGFHAKAAFSGESALEIAASFGPDCLLSDVLMPGMNGVELAIEFRKLLPASRVVLMSGQIGISDILDDAEREGFTFELLSKPILPRNLIDQLRKTPKR
jgi:CheY-like chemotaxis protein